MAAVVVFGVLSMMYIHSGLVAVEKHLERLDEVEVPLLASAFEMEVNSEEYALEVLKYLARPNPMHRVAAADDSADFSRHRDNFLQLSKSKRMRVLGQELGVMHDKLVTMGEGLLQLEDKKDEDFESVTEHLQKIDELIDRRLPQVTTRTEPLRSRAIAAHANVEAEAAEVGFWLASYLHMPSPLMRRRIAAKHAELDSALAEFLRLPSDTQEKRVREELATLHRTAKSSIDRLLATDDSLTKATEEFVKHQDGIDDVLDDRVQVLAFKSLAEPREDADEAAEAVLDTLRFLIPIYVLLTVLGGLFLVLTIIRPLRRLAAGTEVIGGGDLAHRIEERGGDEFEDLARRFNRMVSQLQETTVSKGELQTSDRKLRATVAELQQEIAERERSEREQARLRAELQRSEAMAAIGALMAGVAHEVRNPLFAISSALEAMETHLEVRAEDARYHAVLHNEVARLKRLMNDLLEYGRPLTGGLIKGRVSKVIADAVRHCESHAKSRGISIVNKAVGFDELLQMSQDRLMRAFMNLIENAAQHAPTATDVTVSAKATRDENDQPWVEITIEDTGAGFNLEDLPSVFDPFFTRRRGGTGLGLSIAQRIVEEHKGQIVAGNRPEGGAILTVRLPIEMTTRGT